MRDGFGTHLRNLWLALSRQHRKLEKVSKEYWSTSDFTFLAGEEYYAKRERAMREVLSTLGKVETAVDVGCGDGRFSLLIAEYASSLVGYDISPALINAARQRAADRGIAKVQFRVAEVEQVPTDDEFHLVACLGVVSCIHDDQKFLMLVRKLVSLSLPGGYLILVDTLGRNGEITKAYRNGYVARYRAQNEYESMFLGSGLKLSQTVQISAMAEQTVNNLYVFRKS